MSFCVFSQRWRRQFVGQVYRVSILKSRKPFSLLLELLIPFMLISSLVYIKGLASVVELPPTTYANEATQVPTIEEIAGQVPFSKFYSYNFINYFNGFSQSMNNIAWSCDAFLFSCQELKWAILPENEGNDQQIEMVESLRTNLENRGFASRLMTLKSSDDLSQYIESSDYGNPENPPIGAAIVFNDQKDYTIVVNSTNVPFERSATNDLARGKTSYSSEFKIGGLLSMQIAIDEFLMNNTKEFRTNMFPLPTPEFNSDVFWEQAGGNTLALLVLLATLYPIALMIGTLVDEKESKFRELMLVMGLSPSALFLAWLCLFMAFFLLQSAILTLITAAGNILKASDKSIVFLWYLLYFYAAIGHSMMISSFFDRKTLASMVGLLLAFSGYLLYITLDGPETPLIAKLISSVFHPTAAFGYGTSVFAAMETPLIGVQWDNFGGDNSSYDGAFTMQTCFMILGFDIVFYLFLAALFDGVISFNFFKRRTSRYDEVVQSIEQEEEEQQEIDPRQQPVPRSLLHARRDARGVVIHNLSKTFKSRTRGVVKAVQGMNLSLYEGQITALLGPNGVGKSTTQQMITGLLKPTKGTSFVNGLESKHDAFEIRQQLGVCPQHNVLSPSLSVKEHLDLFASIKCMDRKVAAARVKRMIAKVGLKKQSDDGANYLSGGMKRKLQLAIALLDANVIILDEPSAGLDITSRQHVQNTISEMRDGRTILLTTHYLDEADRLADRIAIMTGGKVNCCGSSLFLKNKYGVGYILNCSLALDAEPQAVSRIMKVVQQRVPSAELIDQAAAEISIQMPLGASKEFPALLRSLEDNKESLSLNNTGISVTTLDSVFLKVVEEEDEEDENDADSASTKSSRKSGGSGALVSPQDSFQFDVDLEGQEDDDHGYVKPDSVRTLLNKRLIHSKRDRKAWCCQFMIPIVFLAAGFLTLGLALSSPRPAYESSGATDDWNSAPSKISNLVPHNTRANDIVDSLNIPRLTPDELQFTLPYENQKFCVDSDSFTENQNWVLTYFTYFELPGLENFSFDVNDTCAGKLFDDNIQFFSDEIQKMSATFESSIYSAFIVNNVEGDQIEYTVGYNFTSVYAMPYMMNRVHSSIAGFEISTTVDVFPPTQREQQIEEGFNAFGATLAIGIALSFVPAWFAVFVTREKENKSWYQQLVNGVSPFSYWISNYVFDLITYYIFAAIALILIRVVEIDVYLGENLTAVLLLFILYGLAVVPFTFCVTFIFESTSGAQFGALVIHLLGAVVFLMISFIMFLIDGAHFQNERLIRVYRALPSFCFAHGLLSISNQELIEFVNNRESRGGDPSNPEKYDAFSNEIAGVDIYCLAGQSVAYLLLLVLLQYKFRVGTCRSQAFATNSAATDQESAIQLEDDDVKEERRIVESMSEKELREEMAAMIGVRKVYSNGKIAVQNASLRFRKNECFGLLGSNGAGKSTLLETFSGMLLPSAGHMYIGGYDVVSQQAMAQNRLGYCPQADAHFDLLTGREHLNFYCAIKGVPKEMIKPTVDSTLEALGLTKFADKLAVSYSGGNKRKLSLAIATVGTPALVLADEVSAGIDFKSRQKIAKYMEELTKKTSVILTTHSMDEAESLCNRATIMVDGGFRCLGTIQHIKNKYADGYILDVGLRGPTEQEINDLIVSFGSPNEMDVLDEDRVKRILLSHDFNTPAVSIKAKDLADWIFFEKSFSALSKLLETKISKRIKLKSRSGLHFKYHIPANTSKLADMFQALESNRSSAFIQEFSLSQSTLESIFNQFVEPLYT